MPTDTPTGPEHAPLKPDPGLADLLNARPWARQLPTGGPSLPGVYEILLDLINANADDCRPCSEKANERVRNLRQAHRAALVTIGAHICALMAHRAGLPSTVGVVFIKPILARLITTARPIEEDKPSPETSDEVFALAQVLLDDPAAFATLVTAIVETALGIGEYEAAAAASD